MRNYVISEDCTLCRTFYNLVASTAITEHEDVLKIECDTCEDKRKRAVIDRDEPLRIHFSNKL